MLVVVADQARGRLPDNAGHRLRMSEPYTAGIVHVPYVEAWRHLDQPIASAFHALTGGLTQQIPSRAARGFADTAARLVRALTVRLDGAAPQPSTRGVAAGVPAVSRRCRRPNRHRRPRRAAGCRRRIASTGYSDRRPRAGGTTGPSGRQPQQPARRR